MRIAILSDIHSNLSALQAVLKDVKRLGVDQIFSLGDVIGYAAQPKECLDLIMNHPKVKVRIRGNHEDEVIKMFRGDRGESRMNNEARFALTYSYGNLSQEDFRAILAWPEIKSIKELGLTLAHGAVTADHVWRYTSGLVNDQYEAEHSPTRICLLGHTHCPFVFSTRRNCFLDPIRWHVLSDIYRFAINVGSVGQPRDGNTQAAYGILEIKRGRQTYRLRRVSYDIEQAKQAILRAYLPEKFALRLLEGW